MPAGFREQDLVNYSTVVLACFELRHLGSGCNNRLVPVMPLKLLSQAVSEAAEWSGLQYASNKCVYRRNRGCRCTTHRDRISSKSAQFAGL